MNFYVIKNVEQDQVNGILIESKEGLVHGRLAGDEGTSDPARVLPFLLKRMPSGGFPVEKTEGGSRVVNWIRPGQEGFVQALLRRMRPPLVLTASGTVPKEKIASPDQMTAALWRTFAEGEMPRHEALPLP